MKFTYQHRVLLASTLIAAACSTVVWSADDPALIPSSDSRPVQSVRPKLSKVYSGIRQTSYSPAGYPSTQWKDSVADYCEPAQGWRSHLHRQGCCQNCRKKCRDIGLWFDYIAGVGPARWDHRPPPCCFRDELNAGIR